MKQYTGEVMFLRLNNGEDVISSIFSEGQEMTLKSPLKILYLSNPGSPNRLSISLMQWVFQRISSEQTFDIDRRDVLLIADANENLIKYYHETIDHFEEIKDKIDEAVKYQNSEDPMIDMEEDIDDEDFDYQEAIEPEEGIEMLKNFLESVKRNPKKLH